jgi:hypothetical protein
VSDLADNRSIHTISLLPYVREPTVKEELHGKTAVTQFGRMCQKLDIRIIAANSAPAKGRVERGNGTHQDRLIKKMGRRKIRTHAAANRFLQKEYLEQHNERYAQEPAEPQDYHRKASCSRDLDRCFVWRRSAAFPTTGWCGMRIATFSWERRSDYPPRQAKVTACEWEDGRIEIRYQGKARPHNEIEAPRKEQDAIRLVDKPRRASRWKPPASHSWKRPGSAAAMLRTTASASP